MPNRQPVIAVDAMGGDHGPSVVVPGALQAARADGFGLRLVGDQAQIEAQLQGRDLAGLDVQIVHAPEVAGMKDKPSEVVRRKKGSSIHVAVTLVKDGLADGVVSAGNSGATVACGMFILGRIPGILRPALASVMPTAKRPMILIDVGANVDAKPKHLLQFGLMADIMARDVLGIETPRVALMSIGEEEGKGNTQVKETFALMRASSLHFAGNAEGRDVFTGDLDVVVCDGFVGNVALKLSEGLGQTMGQVLKREITRTWLGRLGTMLNMGGLKRFARIVDYAEYGGAPLLGLKGIVVVCHGASNVKAIMNAVKMGARFVRQRSISHLEEELARNLSLTENGETASA